MPPERTTVFLPCHTLDDFPTWLDEAESDDLLAAWTAAWHPCLIAAVGAPPLWASIDLPVAGGPQLGIVPATWDDRFAAQFDALTAAGSLFVRRIQGSDAIVRAAAEALASDSLPEGPLPGDSHCADFQALGLASLLAELLARRMRSSTDLEAAEFPAAVVKAARAAVDGRDADVAAALRECFDSLAATRGRYYPVDSWLVDLVLLSGTTSGAALTAALDSPVPVAVVATGEAIASIAAASPAAFERLRDAAATGRVALCGGRDDDRPLDGCTPEEVLASFQRGRALWKEHVGAVPAMFARVAGGATALLPQVLGGLGCKAGIWSLFDGSALPDVGRGLIRWEAGGGSVEMVASQPLDARSVRTTLALHETLGDALDHEHVAILVFAQYAGTASRWHTLLRRIGSWTNLLGTFVTPDHLVQSATGSGTPVSLEPDAFPPSLPRDGVVLGSDPVDQAIAAARTEARRIVAAAVPLAGAVPASAAPAPSRAAPRPASRSWLPRRLFGSRHTDAERLVLENGVIRAEAHAVTGGLLSLRRPADRGNRVSQQLAVRTTRSAATTGGVWEHPDDRGVFTRMVADTVAREKGVDGRDAIVSRGRLIDADGGTAARFTQRLALADALPLAVIDVEIRLERPLAGPLFENHVAARFAWHENEDIEMRRSLHTQSIATERVRFTAPHFIEVVSGHSRLDAGADTLTILTGGASWHLLTLPHVLDTILAGGAAAVIARRFAVGVGIARPWDAALALLADAPLTAGLPAAPANVRVTVHGTRFAQGLLVGARVGLLEAAGRGGEVRVDWGREVASAVVVDLDGAPRSDVTVAIEGRCTVGSLERYQWLHLDLEFAG
ncbi:MAG: hypothetical protein K8S94_08460 [Planctomycetia bacterium]|nr:hypothetical protein [Planctomycetia bacterium]